MHDLIAVGGGLAGVCAALRATQLGLSAAVLEKGTAEDYLNNTRYANTVFHVGYRDPKSTPAELKKALQELTGGAADNSLLDLLADNASRAVDWLEACGIQFQAGRGYRSRMATPTRPDVAGLVWRDVGGDALLQTLERVLATAGVPISRGHRCTGITPHAEGFLVNVETPEGPRQLAARSVVLADGGFHANPELLRKYVSPHPERLFQRAAGESHGDALQMAQAAGGDTVGMQDFYGHLLHEEAFTNPQLWPHPWLDRVIEAGVLLDSRGERFVEEASGGIKVANIAARHPFAQRMATIFDAETWETLAANLSTGMVPPNPNLVTAGATIHTADDVTALAAKLNMPADAVTRTIDEFNASLARPGAEAIVSPKGIRQRPIRTAPFYAVGVTVGITNTAGGIRIDPHCRVAKAGGGVVDRLYAAGTAVGGFDGGPEAAYTGGLMRTVITALVAAEDAASRLASKGDMQ